MQTQYINEMLNIPELQIHQILPVGADEIHIEATLVAKKQCCPICLSDEYVILKGSNDPRKVHHLAAFEKRVYLKIPSIRMLCTNCEASFVWSYGFVGPKKRYSHLIQEKIVEQAYGSTAEHSARIQQTPASTVQRMHNEAIPIESERLPNKHGNKQKKVAVWYWVSMILPLRKAIPTIPASTI